MSEKIPRHDHNKFLVENYVMRRYGLNTDDKTNSEKLEAQISQANRQIAKDMIPYLDDIIADDTDFFADCRDAAYDYFRHVRLADDRLYEESEKVLSMYKYTIKTLKESAKAQPEFSQRTIISHATGSYRTPLLKNIPGMTDTNGVFF